ncbi:MAG: exo-alpha-sialidase [Planctomycetaceae bacterium]
MKMLYRSLVGLQLLFWVGGYVAADEPLYKEEFIFDPQAASHGHVHASSIVECPNGDLRAVWYENGPALPIPPYYNERKDKSDDVRIGGSRKAAGSGAWETPFVMSDTFGVSDNNPAMVVDREGRLWLFHSTMLAAPEWSWGSSLLRYMIATDYQQAGPPKWEKSELLFPRVVGFDNVLDQAAKQLESLSADNKSGFTKARVDAYLGQLRKWTKDAPHLRLGWMPRAHPLVRADGALVVPLSNENFSIPAMAITSDAGATWTFSQPVPEIGLIQPTLVDFGDGTMDAYFRNSDQRRRIKRSTSTDGGVSWSKPELTDRLHPGGGLEVTRLKNGHLLLVYNNKERDPRDKLAVSISTDRGRTWSATRQLEDTPNARFDYPSVIQANDGTVHVSYSYNLQTIKHVQFNEEWVQAGDGK